MYLLIIYLPLISAITGLTMGRYIGERGMSILGPSLLILSSILSLLIYKEVIIDGIEVNVQGITWMEIGGVVEINWGLKYDSLTATMLIVVLIVSTLVHIYSTEYMAGDPHKVRFISYLSLFTFFMLILVTSSNYLQLFIGWEGVGLCSYLLINFWTTRILAGKAAIKAMVVNRIGDVGLVLAMFLILWTYNSLDYSVVFSSITDNNIINIIVICMLIASAGKSAQMILHTWLPDAMEGFKRYKWALLKLYYMREHPVRRLWYTFIRNHRETIGNELVKIQSNGQSAGNFKKAQEVQKGSSETIRKAYKKEFIDWLVGFTEGDGSFIISERNLEFKITQSSTDVDVLFYIKEELGFGSVVKQCQKSNMHQYRVRDKENIGKIIEIFNGRLQLKKRKEQFEKWVQEYNKNYNGTIVLKENEDLINLESTWIAGFTDAEGCFTVSVMEKGRKNPNILVRFVLSQQREQEVLERIAKLMNGRLAYLKSYDGFNMTVQSTKLSIVKTYFARNKLKTKKRIAYIKWEKIHIMVQNQEHLNNYEIVEKIKKLAKKINN